MITWREAAVKSRIPGDGLSMERNHHPPAEQERSLADRIDIDDEDRDGVSMWEREKKNPIHLSQYCCSLFQHCCCCFVLFFSIPCVTFLLIKKHFQYRKSAASVLRLTSHDLKTMLLFQC